MDIWKKIKRDIQRSIREGKAVAKKGAKKLTKEGQNKLKIYELEVLVQRQLTELGSRIYDLSSQNKNPMNDAKVKKMVGRLNKLEKRIAKKIDGEMKKPSSKSDQRRKAKTRRKTTFPK